MRYEDIELPLSPWIIRLCLEHDLTPDGETHRHDKIDGRRQAAERALPIWSHQNGNATNVRFPDPIVVDYVSARLLPIVEHFHTLTTRICGRLLSAPAAREVALEGIKVRLLADLEIWEVRERPTQIEFSVEAPALAEGAIRLLCQLTADAPNFTRRAFGTPSLPTELTAVRGGWFARPPTAWPGRSCARKPMPLSIISSIF